MAKFKIIQHRDAVIRYETMIEAETAAAAPQKAKRYDCRWTTGDCAELNHAEMEVQDLSGSVLIEAREIW